MTALTARAFLSGAILTLGPFAGLSHAAEVVGAIAPQPGMRAAARPALRHGVFKFSSYPAAWTAAQSSSRPILVFATSPNCPHCVRMISDSLRAPPVCRFLNESFETVYSDRFEQPELVAKLGVRRFPTTFIVGPDNQVIDVLEGYVDAKTLAARLQTSVAAQQAPTQTR